MSHLGKKITHTAHKIRRHIDALHTPYNINGKQSRMLGFIAHESLKRDVYQRDIEDEFNIRRSSVTSMLQNLERAGLVIRENVKSDARLKKLVLTDKGKELSIKTYHNIVDFEERIEGLFNEDELNHFKSYLDRVFEYLKEKEDK